jgi:hypothetical protein
VGPGERPPAHANDENKLEDEEQIDEEAMKGMTEEQRQKIMTMR